MKHSFDFDTECCAHCGMMRQTAFNERSSLCPDLTNVIPVTSIIFRRRLNLLVGCMV